MVFCRRSIHEIQLGHRLTFSKRLRMQRNLELNDTSFFRGARWRENIGPSAASEWKRSPMRSRVRFSDCVLQSYRTATWNWKFGVWGCRPVPSTGETSNQMTSHFSEVRCGGKKSGSRKWTERFANAFTCEIPRLRSAELQNCSLELEIRSVRMQTSPGTGETSNQMTPYFLDVHWEGENRALASEQKRSPMLSRVRFPDCVLQNYRTAVWNWKFGVVRLRPVHTLAKPRMWFRFQTDIRFGGTEWLRSQRLGSTLQTTLPSEGIDIYVYSCCINSKRKPRFGCRLFCAERACQTSDDGIGILCFALSTSCRIICSRHGAARRGELARKNWEKSIDVTCSRVRLRQSSLFVARRIHYNFMGKL